MRKYSRHIFEFLVVFVACFIALMSMQPMTRAYAISTEHTMPRTGITGNPWAYPFRNHQGMWRVLSLPSPLMVTPSPLPDQPVSLPYPSGIMLLPDMHITTWWIDKHSHNDAWISGTYTISPPLCYTHCHNFVDTAQFFERYTGKVWKIVPSPSADSYTAYMPYAMAGTSPRDIWTVGYINDSNLTNHAFLEHWNGSLWSTENPVFPDTASPLAAEMYHVYAFSSHLVYAVGMYNEPDGIYLLIDKFNGSTWSNIPFPDQVTFLSLQRKANHITMDVQYPNGQITTVIIDSLR